MRGFMVWEGYDQCWWVLWCESYWEAGEGGGGGGGLSPCDPDLIHTFFLVELAQELDNGTSVLL